MNDYWTKNNLVKPKTFVVAAACKHPELNLMVVGARHWDRVMNAQYKALKPHLQDGTSKWEQGFINQFGEFLTRKDAMIAAIAFGQAVDIKRGCGGDTEELYSEGLY